MNTINLGDSAELKDFPQNATLTTSDAELSDVLRVCNLETDNITGVLTIQQNGEFVFIATTNDTAPFSNNALYRRVL